MTTKLNSKMDIYSDHTGK